MNVFPIEEDLPTTGEQHTGEQADQQCFTAIGRTHHRDYVASIYIKLLNKECAAVLNDLSSYCTCNILAEPPLLSLELKLVPLVPL